MFRILIFSVFILVTSCSSDYGSQAVELYRSTKDSSFRLGENSPFKKRGDFTQLNYFPYAEDYIITAKVTKIDNPEIVQMPTTTDRLPVYLKKYRFDFEWEDQAQVLWGYYKKDNPNAIFLPFKDLTNGKETYGGGRYLDILLPFKGDELILDFNYAYHPYCHYDTGYSCPIVPFENHLKVSIRAGEKKYE